MANDECDTVELYVETAPFPQTIECPECDAEMRFLIEDTDIGGTRCEKCGVDITYVHDRRNETTDDETEQSELVTDGGVDRDDAGISLMAVTVFVTVVAFGAFVGSAAFGNSIPNVIGIALAAVASIWMTVLSMGGEANGK